MSSSRALSRRAPVVTKPGMSRADWLQFAEAARQTAHTALAGPVSREALSDLYRRAGVAAECSLPVLSDVAHHAKAALVAGCKGLCVEPGRATWAGLVMSAASTVCDLVVEAQNAAAAGWQRNIGGER